MATKYGLELAKNFLGYTSEKDFGFVSESATGLFGFRSAASSFQITPVTLSTTGNTATAIYTKAVPLSASVSVYAFITGKKAGATADAITSFKGNGASNAAGTVAVHGTTSGFATDPESSGGTPAVTIVADDTADTIVVKVAGISAEDWVWKGFVITVTAQG